LDDFKYIGAFLSIDDSEKKWKKNFSQQNGHT
jgi:hypothetical protein